jgi:hypothetical protein
MRVVFNNYNAYFRRVAGKEEMEERMSIIFRVGYSCQPRPSV